MDDYFVWVSRGKFPGHGPVRKWGNTDNVSSAGDTDIWTMAKDGAADNQAIFVAPTMAQKHTIASDSPDDNGSPAGIGARTIRASGLTAWDEPEAYEDLTMNGVIDVLTSKSYVIIHRLEVLTKGGARACVGNITAIAQVDGTKTARMLAGKGQTQQAIRGISSIQDFEMTQLWGNLISKASEQNGGQQGVELSLLVNPEPDAELTGFIWKHGFGLSSTGTSYINHRFRPTFPIPGPAIVKLQARGDTTTKVKVSAGFDGVLIDNGVGTQ